MQLRIEKGRVCTLPLTSTHLYLVYNIINDVVYLVDVSDVRKQGFDLTHNILVECVALCELTENVICHAFGCVQSVLRLGMCIL